MINLQMNWKNLNPLNRKPLSNEIDGLIHGWLGSLGWPTIAPGYAGDTESTMPRQLRKGVELIENRRSYQLRIDVPGLDRKDLKWRVEDDKLVITGAKREGDKKGYRLFSRAIPLPKDADDEKLSASLRDGHLTITLPRGQAGELAVV